MASIYKMSEEEWSNHYIQVLNTKTDRGDGDQHPTNCWNFTGRINKGGYGVIDIVIPGQGKTSRTAHRLSYLVHELKSWQLPKHIEASHRCGNKLCVGPSHIVPESHEYNKSRQICHGLGRCMGHNPECIFP